MWIAALILFWIACGVLHFGLTFGYFQNAYPDLAKDNYNQDWFFAAIFSLLGPIALIAHYFWVYASSIHGPQPIKWK